MAITRGRAPRDDSDEGEVTAAETREAMRVQRELLLVLHSDREAKTRADDSSPLARTLAAAVPLLLGVLIGVLGTISLLSGRISTLEAESKQHGDAIGRGAESQARTLELVTRLDAFVRTSTITRTR